MSSYLNGNFIRSIDFKKNCGGNSKKILAKILQNTFS